MKTMKNILIVATLAASVLSMRAANLDIGVGTLPGPGSPQGTGYEDPIIVEGRTTSIGTTPPVLPTNVTATAFAAFTNFNFRIVRDSDITFTLKMGSLPTNSAATSNALLRVELSPDGRTFCTGSPLWVPFAQNGSNVVLIRSATIGATNFSAFAWGRITGMSNSMTSGAGNMWPSNVIVSQWRLRSNLR